MHPFKISRLDFKKSLLMAKGRKGLTAHKRPLKVLIRPFKEPYKAP